MWPTVLWKSEVDMEKYYLYEDMPICSKQCMENKPYILNKVTYYKHC